MTTTCIESFVKAKEFEYLVKKAGFSPMDAIKAGTSVEAEFLGRYELLEQRKRGQTTLPGGTTSNR